MSSGFGEEAVGPARVWRGGTPGGLTPYLFAREAGKMAGQAGPQEQAACLMIGLELWGNDYFGGACLNSLRLNAICGAISGVDNITTHQKLGQAFDFQARRAGPSINVPAVFARVVIDSGQVACVCGVVRLSVW